MRHVAQYSRTDAQMSEEAEPLADARPQSEDVASSGLARGPPFANVSAGSTESNRSGAALLLSFDLCTA